MDRSGRDRDPGLDPTRLSPPMAKEVGDRCCLAGDDQMLHSIDRVNGGAGAMRSLGRSSRRREIRELPREPRRRSVMICEDARKR